MREIVCLSTSNYYPIPTRKQQVMNRLHDARILYFDPPVSVLAPLKDERAKERITLWKQPGNGVRDNLTVYALPPVWPFYNKYRAVNRRNQHKLAKFIRGKMEEAGMELPILWCYSPTSCDLLDRVPHSALVYDCVDRHSAYQGFINPKVVDRMEAQLAARADQVFCTADGLYNTLSKINPTTRLIPNGANYPLFSRVETEREALLRAENELSELTGPVLGFVGALQECIDYELLEYVARERPQWQLVLIGALQPGVDVSGLERLPNVHLLGLRPYESLPEYMVHFDLCLNVFRSGDLARDVSPLKFYEYLATGKPVVSTPQPLQVRDYADGVYVADSRADFLLKCQAALEERGEERKLRRLAYGEATSWDARVAEIERVLEERGL